MSAGDRLCPMEAQMRRTLAIRRQPLVYRDRPENLQRLASLGGAVECFNWVLVEKLNQ